MDVYLKGDFIMVKRSVSNETRVKKVKAMINAGATWEDCAEEMGLSEKYLQSLVRASYKTESSYNKLLAKARANKKARAEEKKVIGNDPTDEEVKEVILLETGYILERGIDQILDESLDLFIPFFNIKELDKLSDSYEVAEKFLTIVYSSGRITSLNLKGRETIFEEPSFSVKDRTFGVVASACYLWSMGYRVRLLTNSFEIEALANAQGVDEIVVCRYKRP